MSADPCVITLSPAELQASPFPELDSLDSSQPEISPDGDLGPDSSSFSPPAQHAPSGTWPPVPPEQAQRTVKLGCAVLQAVLADGARPAAEVAQWMRRAGFSLSTMKRAKAALSIMSTKARHGTFRDGWLWSLPADQVEVAQAAAGVGVAWSDLEDSGGDGGPPDRKSTNPAVSAHDPDPVASATARLELARKAQGAAEIELARLRTQLPAVSYAALSAEPGAMTLLRDLEASINQDARMLERSTASVEHAERLVQAAVADVEERTRAAREARIAAAREQRDAIYVEVEMTVDHLAELIVAAMATRTDLADQDERRWVSAAIFNYVSRRLHLAGLTEMRMFSGLGESLAPAKKGDQL